MELAEKIPHNKIGKLRRGGINLARDEAIANRRAQQRHFISIIETGKSAAAACRETGIKYHTLMKWKEMPGFKRALEIAFEINCDDCEDRILGASETDWKAAESYLRTYRKEKWGRSADSSVNIDNRSQTVIDASTSLTVTGALPELDALLSGAAAEPPRLIDETALPA